MKAIACGAECGSTSVGSMSFTFSSCLPAYRRLMIRTETRQTRSGRRVPPTAGTRRES
jgi:hypothetical protein